MSEGNVIDLPTIGRYAILNLFYGEKLQDRISLFRIFNNLWSRRSIVLAPAGTGKTFIAILWTAMQLMNGNRVMICVPTRALVHNHFNTMKEFFPEGSIRAIISKEIDDWTPEDYTDLSKYAVIITTYHKGYRLGAMHKITDAIVLDEVHCVRNNRYVDFVLALEPKYILLMTATLREEEVNKIAEKLELDIISVIPENASPEITLTSPIEEGTFVKVKVVRKYESYSFATGMRLPKIRMVLAPEGSKLMTETEEIPVNLIDIINFLMPSKIIVFTSSRENSERLAKYLNEYLLTNSQLQDKIKKYFNIDNFQKFLDAERKEERYFAMYHHAGVPDRKREFIEKSFYSENSFPLVITCTTTLALGVNLPAQHVIIYNVFSFPCSIPEIDFKGQVVRVKHGKYDITPSMVMQMAGRAGRFVSEKDHIHYCMFIYNGQDKPIIIDTVNFEVEKLTTEVITGYWYRELLCASEKAQTITGILDKHQSTFAYTISDIIHDEEFRKAVPLTGLRIETCLQLKKENVSLSGLLSLIVNSIDFFERFPNVNKGKVISLLNRWCNGLPVDPYKEEIFDWEDIVDFVSHAAFSYYLINKKNFSYWLAIALGIPEIYTPLIYIGVPKEKVYKLLFYMKKNRISLSMILQNIELLESFDINSLLLFFRESKIKKDIEKNKILKNDLINVIKNNIERLSRNMSLFAEEIKAIDSAIINQ